MTVNWRFVLSKWWKAALMGLLIAIGIALWPRAQCAVAQTCNGPRDKWCGSGKCCGPTSGVEWYDRNFRCFPNGSYCAHSQVLKSDVVCSGTSDCNVTDWKKVPASLRGRIGNQTAIDAGRCQWVNNDPSTGKCELVSHLVPVTCCNGSSGGGSCTPQYAPPTIDDTYTVDPPNPIVWAQEQPPYGEALGMTLNDIKAHGGQDTTCGTGQRASITSIRVWVTLSQGSIDWIFNDLARRYLNVHLNGQYPQYPEVPPPDHPYRMCQGAQGWNTPDAELDCQFFRPLDPGRYEVHVEACQSDGKCTTKTLPDLVSVWLLESRLLAPEP